MGRVHMNNYGSTITTVSVADIDTTFDVTSAPLTLAAGEYYLATLTDSLTAPTKTEIIKITGIATNTLTVERAQEETAAFAWVSGDIIEIRVTASSLDTPDNPVFVTYTETVAAGTVDLNPNIGTIQTYTLPSNSTFTESFVDGQSLILHINAGASFTATWPTMTWVGGTQPTLTAADVISFWKVGGTLFGAYVGSVA